MNPEMQPQGTELSMHTALEQIETLETLEEVDTLLISLYRLPFADWQTKVASEAMTKAREIFTQIIDSVEEGGNVDEIVELYSDIGEYPHLTASDREDLRQKTWYAKMKLSGELE